METQIKFISEFVIRLFLVQELKRDLIVAAFVVVLQFRVDWKSESNG
jgi:hypothetical protein